MALRNLGRNLAFVWIAAVALLAVLVGPMGWPLALGLLVVYGPAAFVSGVLFRYV